VRAIPTPAVTRRPGGGRPALADHRHRRAVEP